MKLLVLLAVLGAVSAQYKVYTGYTPYVNGYSPFTYGAHPLNYAAHPLTYAAPVPYAAHPYIHGLPLNFKPAEENASEEKPVVESRSKRSAEEDQKAEEATFYSTYASHPYPLTYTAGYPYTYPTVYNSVYNPVAYSGLYNSFYHGYTAPAVHSLKKRDTAAAEEDQKAEDATYVTSYAAHPFTYNAGYPYTTYSAAYRAPAVYSAPAAAVPYSGVYGFPYTYGSYYG